VLSLRSSVDPPESTPEQTTLLLYKRCYKLTVSQGRVIGEFERSERQCGSSWYSRLQCVPNHAFIHSLTHTLTHTRSTHSSFHLPTLLLFFPWPKLIYAALCQLPSFHHSDLNCVSAAYQPTVNKGVPESNKWLMPDAATQLQHALLSVEPAWAFNDPTSTLKDNSHWPHYFCPYPQWIFVGKSLLPANINKVWYAAVCKVCCTSCALLTPARASSFTQT
jgi:hypothetical protein